MPPTQSAPPTLPAAQKSSLKNSKLNPSSSNSPPVEEDPDDDYMSMTIAEPTQPPTKETYTQRRIRKQREAEAKAHSQSHPQTPSALLASGLATSLPPTSKGFQMLSKLGYKPGSALGAAGNMNGVLEPVVVEMKAGREGVGLANERKRKVREEAEGREEGEREEAEGYRVRVAREREAKRMEGLLGGAMRVLEGMEEGNAGKRVNVLYRGLVRQRREEERVRRARYDLHQSLSRSAAYEADEGEEDQDRLAWGREEEDEGGEDGDEELEAFEALPLEERLERVVGYLREKYWYCFWCKSQYDDADMEGCPGMTEGDHD